MPHFGLVPDDIPEADALILRARLHWKGGIIRFTKGMITDGVAALYDALISGMYRYTLLPEWRVKMKIKESTNLDDDSVLFRVLENVNIFKQEFTREDFEGLLNITEKALENKLQALDIDTFIDRIRRGLEKLDVLPFTESEIPNKVSITT